MLSGSVLFSARGGGGVVSRAGGGGRNFPRGENQHKGKKSLDFVFSERRVFFGAEGGGGRGYFARREHTGKTSRALCAVLVVMCCLGVVLFSGGGVFICIERKGRGFN